MRIILNIFRETENPLFNYVFLHGLAESSFALVKKNMPTY